MGADLTHGGNAEQFIRSHVVVTRQMVRIAKQQIAVHPGGEARRIIDGVVGAMKVPLPDRVVLHASVDPLPQLEAVANHLSWHHAAAEAVWSLIHAGVFVPGSGDLLDSHVSVGWTTIVPASGSGFSGDWVLETPPVPRLLRRCLSWSQERELLCDPDLYLDRLVLQDIDPEVTEALAEAVLCFRYELYLASVAMLGKASEALWVRFGLALGLYLERTEPKAGRRLQDHASDGQLGVEGKVRRIMNVVKEQKEIQDVVLKAAGVRIRDLEKAAAWTNLVRDARNALHPNRKPIAPNNYEKVAILLLCTRDTVDKLTSVIAAARETGQSDG